MSQGHFNIFPRHTIMSLDISYQTFYRMSTRSAGMPWVGGGQDFLRHSALPKPRSLVPRRNQQSTWQLWLCAVSAAWTEHSMQVTFRVFFLLISLCHSFFFFFYIYSTLSYLYFTPICCFFFNFILSLLLCHSSCSFLGFPLSFIYFSVFSILWAVSLRLSVSTSTLVQAATLFLAFGKINIRLPARTPNLRVVAVFFWHTS